QLVLRRAVAEQLARRHGRAVEVAGLRRGRAGAHPLAREGRFRPRQLSRGAVVLPDAAVAVDVDRAVAAQGEGAVEAGRSVGGLEDLLPRPEVQPPQRVALARLQVAPPDVALAVQDRGGRAAPRRQVGEDDGLARLRVVLVELPAGHLPGPVVVLLAGAV